MLSISSHAALHVRYNLQHSNDLTYVSNRYYLSRALTHWSVGGFLVHGGLASY